MRYLFKRDYIFYFQIVSVCIYTMSFFYITQLSMCSSDKRASTHSWRVLGFKPSHAFFLAIFEVGRVWCATLGLGMWRQKHDEETHVYSCSDLISFVCIWFSCPIVNFSTLFRSMLLKCSTKEVLHFSLLSFYMGFSLFFIEFLENT